MECTRNSPPDWRQVGSRPGKCGEVTPIWGSRSTDSGANLGFRTNSVPSVTKFSSSVLNHILGLSAVFNCAYITIRVHISRVGYSSQVESPTPNAPRPSVHPRKYRSGRLNTTARTNRPGLGIDLKPGSPAAPRTGEETTPIAAHRNNASENHVYRSK